MLGQSLYATGQAIAMVPIAVEETSAFAIAWVASRLSYLALLLLLPCPADCALWFSKCFALGNLLYLAAIATVAVHVMRKRASRHAVP
jgi:hypothetical protein